MITEVKVINLPESVQEAVIARWHKQPGDAVRAGDKLADLETDKIVLDLGAPANGVLTRLVCPEGATVKSGEVIAEIDAGAVAAGAVTATPASVTRPAATPPAPPKTSTVPVPGPAPAAPAPAPRPAAATTPPAKSVLGSAPVPVPSLSPPASSPAEEEGEYPIPDDLAPAVRRLIVENKLDPALIPGSGRDGRLTKADVIRFLEHSPHLQTKFGEATPQVEIKPEPAPVVPAMPERPEQRVRMTRLRARIAERLLHAQHQAALLTTFNEVNMEAVMQLRSRYKDQFEREHGVKLGFMSFFVKAAVEALLKFPVINASVDGEDIVYHGYFDIGVAVSSPRGLVVPVLRDADRLSLAEMESRIGDFGKRAEAGKLALEELQGGTFTISNGGVFGSLLSTPIVNPPQSAILGMHRIQKRPVVENDQIVIRPMMYLALTYDHRIVDGREAVLFLVAMKEAIEDPTRLLLQI